MKRVISYLLLINLLTINCYSQDAPIQIDNFIIGKTDISDILYKVDRSHINSGSDFERYRIDPDDTIGTYSFCKELFPEDTDTSSYYAYIAPQTDNYRAFLISKLNIEDYPVNNLLLVFYKDTLARFEYDAPGKLLNLITEKYKGKAKSIKNDKELSECKALVKGKRIKNYTNDYTFIDLKGRNYSEIKHCYGLDSGCEFYNYINVHSFNLELATKILEERKIGIANRKDYLKEQAIIKKRETLNKF